MSDSVHDSLDELAEADYWRLRNGPLKEMVASASYTPQAWHNAGYKHGYRDAIRHSASVGAVMPLLRRIADALERE